MVEPHPANFARLQANFARAHGIILENVGISDKQGDLDFYYLRDVEPDEPDWYSQIASFDKDTFHKNISGIPELLDRVAVSPIEAITFDMLLTRHSMPAIDLLLIDAEGYDCRILSSIDLNRHKPGIIIFEHEWLTTHDRKALLSQLRMARYGVITTDFDYVAIRR